MTNLNNDMAVWGINHYEMKITNVFALLSNADLTDKQRIEQLHAILHDAVNETEKLTELQTTNKIKKQMQQIFE